MLADPKYVSHAVMHRLCNANLIIIPNNVLFVPTYLLHIDLILSKYKCWCIFLKKQLLKAFNQGGLKNLIKKCFSAWPDKGTHSVLPQSIIMINVCRYVRQSYLAEIDALRHELWLQIRMANWCSGWLGTKPPPTQSTQRTSLEITITLRPHECL